MRTILRPMRHTFPCLLLRMGIAVAVGSAILFAAMRIDASAAWFLRPVTQEAK